MKKKIIAILIVVGLVLGYLYYFGYLDKWIYGEEIQDGTPYYKQVTKSEVINGNVDVAVIHLAYKASITPEYIDNVRYAAETDITTTNELYGRQLSVTSFYKKYNIHMKWDYYTYKLSSIEKPSTMPACDVDTTHTVQTMLGCRTEAMVYTWLITAPNADGIFDNHDILIFLFESDLDVMTDVSGYVGINAGPMAKASDSWLKSSTWWLRYILAHEIGHLFGTGADKVCGEHYYEPCASDPTEKDCIMNHGDSWLDAEGDEKSGLGYNTNFGQRDTQNELHFNWVTKFIRR